MVALKEEISEVSSIHPLGTMNTCTELFLCFSLDKSDEPTNSHVVLTKQTTFTIQTSVEAKCHQNAFTAGADSPLQQ